MKASDLSYDDLITALRRWYVHQPPNVRAAVELFVTHNHWLGRRDFLDRAAKYFPADDMVGIRWTDAAAAVNDLRGSTSELAILDFAVALGTDRFRFNVLGHGHRALILTAVTSALAGR